MLNTTDRADPQDEWLRQMRDGNWEAAWRVSDEVRAARHGRQPRDAITGEWLPRHLQWVWDGTPFEGRRVLVRCYHGLGDTIQFIRFAPVLRRSAAHVTVWAQQNLLPLLETVAGIDALLPLEEGACPADYDVDIEIMELPYALRATLETLLSDVPYIHVNTKPVQQRQGGRLNVGLVWQSGSWDAQRSIEPELMRRLTRIPSVSWKILQRGPALAAWPAGIGEIPVIHDVVEEAAELTRLDLLICVDTLSAHLAGALGVRTWTLLPARADWRWMENRVDTPWYPTMRLFRQSTPGDWQSVLTRIEHSLLNEIGSAPASSATSDARRANSRPAGR
jgi:hypothetical protein